MVTMTPDEADRAIAEEIGRCDAPLRPAMRKLADLMSRTEQSVDWLGLIRGRETRRTPTSERRTRRCRPGTASCC
jgi:hypothetical protein